MIHPRRPKLRIQWDTDSSTEASPSSVSVTSSNSMLRSETYRSISTSHTESPQSSVHGTPPSQFTPPPLSLPTSSPSHPDQTPTSSPSNTTAPPYPLQPANPAPTTAYQQQGHHQPLPPVPWKHKRGRNQRTLFSYGIISTPKPESTSSPLPPQDHPANLTAPAAHQRQIPPQAPMTSEITNPYVKKKHQVLPQIPTPLAQLELSSPSSKSSTNTINSSLTGSQSSFSSMSLDDSSVSTPPTREFLPRRAKQSTSSLPSTHSPLAEIMHDLQQEFYELRSLTSQLSQLQAPIEQEILQVTERTNQLQRLLQHTADMTTSPSPLHTHNHRLIHHLRHPYRILTTTLQFLNRVLNQVQISLPKLILVRHLHSSPGHLPSPLPYQLTLII